MYSPLNPHLSKSLLKGETSDVSHLSLPLSSRRENIWSSPVGEGWKGWGDKELTRVGFLLLTIYLFRELGNWGIREYFLVA